MPVAALRLSSVGLKTGPFTSAWRNRDLLRQLLRREVANRYRGSLLGLTWALLHPLLMLAVYTCFLGIVLRFRWGGAAHDRGHFALILFAGLIIYNFFAECALRAPHLILENVNYVKKVVFPLEVLPWMVVGSALFQFAAAAAVLLAFKLLLEGSVPWTALLLPLPLLPLALFCLGLGWFLASLGAYLRDTTHIVGLLMQVLMFLSPVFYPLESVPEPFRRLMLLNPLSFLVEMTRGLLLFGTLPSWTSYGASCCAGLAVCHLGFAWFQKTRRGFGDVL